MNRRILVIVLCALVLSVCASYLVYRAVGGQKTVKAPRTLAVVVAARKLVVGSLVREADLKMAPWLPPLPEGATLKLDAFLNRGVASSIYEGEPVTENRLAPKGSGGGFAGTIPPGMRACAVKVNDVVGVAGFVVPGMRVDVLITGLPPGGDALNGPKVRTLLQNIQVLSAGTNFLKDKEGKPEQAQVVNLLVTPSDAEILSLASNEMHIQLVLRNPMDTEISKTQGTIMSDLFGRPAPPEPVVAVNPHNVKPIPHPETPPIPIVAEAPPRPYTIEMSNGSVHSEAQFARSPEKP